MGGGNPFEARTVGPLHLWSTRHVDPGGAIQRHVSPGRSRRNRLGWEAILRLIDLEPVVGITVMVVAAAGIFVNGITALLFASGRNGDLSIRGAYIHMAADAAVSAGVVVAGFVIIFTGWAWLDPVVSLVISAVIVWGTWGLLRDSTAMSLSAVPPGIDPIAVRCYLECCLGVTHVHDLHIWPMSTTEVALTCHLVIPAGSPGDALPHGDRSQAKS